MEKHPIECDRDGTHPTNPTDRCNNVKCPYKGTFATGGNCPECGCHRNRAFNWDKPTQTALERIELREGYYMLICETPTDSGIYSASGIKVMHASHDFHWKSMCQNVANLAMQPDPSESKLKQRIAELEEMLNNKTAS